MDELGFFQKFKDENRMMKGGFDALNGFSPKIFLVSTCNYLKRLSVGA